MLPGATGIFPAFYQKITNFVQTTNTRSAVRDLVVSMANISTFDALVQEIIDAEPLQLHCVCRGWRDHRPGYPF
jgi:predicted component of type VI protein secretion system